ncbi:hypothetical protein QLQ12_07260 [Actinoplanes sp. NEAU-A12]|uniref:YD repeat-containing protein n=1 Tax=Actinoplanes sandaracinus TaxID=3045177 RepID=A0ABT6WF81_9ACTN|nr:hypothetical protein [Actinoplanes sandaracinus]MDI6098399.1 hypothetical protein [Actinoplanes sandaracinus]
MNLTAQDEIAVYVEGVRQALAGLPAATRDELLEDLPEHLAEVLAEGGGSLYERLGPPDAYAAELSASAGVAAGPQPPGEQSRIAETAARHRARIAGLLHRADARVGPVLGYPRASEFLVLLRPAWWILRGYLAAMTVAFMLHDSSEPLGLLPRIDGDGFAAVILLALGILGSIWLGRRGVPARRWPRRFLRLGTAFLVLFAVVGFFEVDSAAQRDYYDQVSYTDGGSRYDEVRDVFVYDGQGRLLQGVQLYDQNGHPIQLGEASCYDADGNWTQVRSGTYPYCLAQAPFPADGTRAGESAAPSAVPSVPQGSGAPASSTGSSTGPAATTPAPTVSR